MRETLGPRRNENAVDAEKENTISTHAQREHLPLAALAAERELAVARVHGAEVDWSFECRDVIANLRRALRARTDTQVAVKDPDFVSSG